jgi:glucose-6-phosphate isomerase
MITRNRKPSRKVLETLLSVTKTIIATFIGNPHLHKPYAQRLNTAHKELEELISVLAVEMELENVVEDIKL